MSKLKRTLSLLLALVMVFMLAQGAFPATALASEPTTSTIPPEFDITIGKPIKAEIPEKLAPGQVWTGKTIEYLTEEDEDNEDEEKNTGDVKITIYVWGKVYTDGSLLDESNQNVLIKADIWDFKLATATAEPLAGEDENILSWTVPQSEIIGDNPFEIEYTLYLNETVWNTEKWYTTGISGVEVTFLPAQTNGYYWEKETITMKEYTVNEISWNSGNDNGLNNAVITDNVRGFTIVFPLNKNSMKGSRTADGWVECWNEAPKSNSDDDQRATVKEQPYDWLLEWEDFESPPSTYRITVRDLGQDPDGNPVDVVYEIQLGNRAGNMKGESFGETFDKTEFIKRYYVDGEPNNTFEWNKEGNLVLRLTDVAEVLLERQPDDPPNDPPTPVTMSLTKELAGNIEDWEVSESDEFEAEIWELGIDLEYPDAERQLIFSYTPSPDGAYEYNNIGFLDEDGKCVFFDDEDEGEDFVNTVTFCVDNAMQETSNRTMIYGLREDTTCRVLEVDVPEDVTPTYYLGDSELDDGVFQTQSEDELNFSLRIVNTYPEITGGNDDDLIHKVNFILYGGEGTFPMQEVPDGEYAAEPETDPTRSEYDFVGWYTEETDGEEFDFETPITKDTDIHARWRPANRVIEDDDLIHKVNFILYGGEGTFPMQEVPDGEYAAEPETDPTRSEYDFVGWYTEEADGEEFDFETPITKDTDIHARWRPADRIIDDPNPPTPEPFLEIYTAPEPVEVEVVPTRFREAYLIGIPDESGVRLISPYSEITRAEIATIFFRKASDEVREQYWVQENPFDDVQLEQWFNNAISTTVNMGLFDGFGIETFEPTQPITRGELAAVLVRFMDVTNAQFSAASPDGDQFDDISDHWAREYINVAAANGWVEGSEGLDGPFNPYQPITRAEATQLFNRVFERLVETVDCLLPDMLAFPDKTSDAWYYTYLKLASNSYTYEFREDNPLYKNLFEVVEPRDWTLLEKPNSRPQDVYGPIIQSE